MKVDWPTATDRAGPASSLPAGKASHSSVPPSGVGRQLLLPLGGAALTTGSHSRVRRDERVFVNRDLKLADIDWLGFDMDYTLAIYQQKALDELSVDLTVDRMLTRGYPRFLSKLGYDSGFPIRGLLVDKRYGNILKMDRFKVVHKGYHGLTRISRRQLHELYQEKQIRPHTQRFHWIDTLFSLSEVTSYAAIVHALEKHNQRLDYAKTFQDVRDSIDEAHRDGHFYRAVTQDLDRYVIRDPELELTLHKFRSAGKKLFLLTNSPWSYTNTMMTYLMGDGRKEYPSWRHYFDAVIVSAQKPLWFREGRPLMERDGDVLRDVRGRLERGKVYEGGNLRDFERRMEIPGSRVLYVGDHIYGDILRSKKESTWRTAMIIQELGAELSAHESCTHEFTRLQEIELSRDRLEDELRFYQARLRVLSRSKGTSSVTLETNRVKRALGDIRRELTTLDRDHAATRERVDYVFHPYWGSLLKEAGERSSFGTQVATYADLYTRRVSGFRHYSPLQHFRSRRDVMPHEV